MIVPISLVAIRRRTQSLQCRWVCSLCCTSHPHDCVYIWRLDFLTPSPFTHSPSPLPSGSRSFVLRIHEFARVLFLCLFCCLDSLCKWNHGVLIFLWLIPLSILPSRFIRVVANGKILFVFFNDRLIFHRIYVSHHLFPFICWNPKACPDFSVIALRCTFLPLIMLSSPCSVLCHSVLNPLNFRVGKFLPSHLTVSLWHLLPRAARRHTALADTALSLRKMSY